MSLSSPQPSSRLWLIFPLLALGFVLWTSYVRVQRVEQTNNLVREPLESDVASATGYKLGLRELIIPERNQDSYHWIVQTQTMLQQGKWRLHHVDYDNAPLGREVKTPSPYRWWLGTVAWVDHIFSARSLGQSVEQAALYADPLLHLVLLVGSALFLGWQFSPYVAVLFSGGVVFLFPFAGGFIPGMPDDRGLRLICAIWSLLPLLTAFRQRTSAKPVGPTEMAEAQSRVNRWFFIGGLVGGFGLWVSVSSQVPVIIGIVLGGLLAAGSGRGEADGFPRAEAWRAWAGGGAVAVFLAYLAEYFPDGMGSWELRIIHPLYGIAWLGLGVALGQGTSWMRQGKSSLGVKGFSLMVLGLLAAAALPVVMWKMGDKGFLAGETSIFRLAKLLGYEASGSLWDWLNRDGFTVKTGAVVLPLLLVLPAGWMFFSGKTASHKRASLALALGPVLVAIGFGCWRIGSWGSLDALLLGLLVVVLGDPGLGQVGRFYFGGAVAGVLAFGSLLLIPPPVTSPLSDAELLGLVERDLAQWLAKRAGPAGALVLAPPGETTPFNYYGGIRGLGTLAWENLDGIQAAIRIVSAATPEESKELIERRGVTHLIIPTWDAYLNEYAQIGMGQVEGTFLARIQAWHLPLWLRPVPYQIPTVAGFENQSATIFEVIEEQSDALAVSRYAAYFVEMGQLDRASRFAQILRRYPADLSVWVARADVALALGEEATKDEALKIILPKLKSGADKFLPMDRRVSLAVVLARTKQMDLAKVQVQRCLQEADEAKLRSLSTGELYRLLVLGKKFNLTMTDARLETFARGLVSADARSRL